VSRFPKPNVKALAREPLLHFLLIGLALFAFYDRVSPGDSDSRRIVISQSQVDDIVHQYQSTWTRSPTPAEMRGLIETFVHNEIVYREGLSMGLDKDDDVIKRRIRQKYELIAEEENFAQPGDADLDTYLKAHPAVFLRPAVITFDQVYFDATTTDPSTVRSVRTALEKGANPATLGDPSMLPRHVAKSGIDIVARDFGEDFGKQVAAAPIGVWVGPLMSGVGLHLVRVNARTPPYLPPIGQVRAAVEREAESDRRSRSSLDDYRKARAGYEVVIKARMP